MILLFLGSWRSTLIVVTSIPLSILASIIVLNMLNQTLNVMTLGGMALAVGILVDDATVEIENNHRHMDLGKPLRQAILDGAAEVATPAFVATLSICIVFVPILFLSGVGGSLFAPLAMAVVFAMLASYFLSRTLVPTMVLYLLAPEAHARQPGDGQDPAAVALRADLRAFEPASADLAGYEGALDWALAHAGGDRRLSALRSLRSACTRSSDATSSRPSMRVSFGCTSGRRRGRGSSRPKPTSSRSRTISAR